MIKYVLATNNKKKLSELKAILQNENRQVVSLEEAGVFTDPEETGASFEENAVIKAEAACKASGLPAIADDSGLCVDALGGEPGVYSARYCPGSDMDRVSFLLRKMGDVADDKRKARFVSAIACVFPNGEQIVVRGECEGSITHECYGGGGFGYDPVFLVESYGLTFAELPQATKNKISHRAVALKRFCSELEKRGM